MSNVIPFPVAPRIYAMQPQRPALYLASIGNVIPLPVIRVERLRDADNVRENGE